MVRPLRAIPRQHALAALLAAVLVLSLPAASAGGPTEAREHALGLWGQDELRRSIRLLENDSDLLLSAFEEAAPGLHADEPRRVELAAAVEALERDLDELRDGYAERLVEARDDLLSDLQELIARGGPLTDWLLALELPRHLRVAAEQVAIDLRRLSSELGRARGDAGWMPRPEVEEADPVQVAAAEIEDLSDDLKRLLLRTDPERPDVERWVVRPGGERHRAVRARLQRAVLEFEEAADELKRAYHRRGGPGDVTDLVDTLVRTARTIDYSVADASTDEEARREWRELRPSLRVLVEAHGLRGIGTGWESAP